MASLDHALEVLGLREVALKVLPEAVASSPERLLACRSPTARQVLSLGVQVAQGLAASS